MSENEANSTFLDRQNECQHPTLIVVKRNRPTKTKEEIEEYLRNSMNDSMNKRLNESSEEENNSTN